MSVKTLTKTFGYAAALAGAFLAADGAAAQAAQMLGTGREVLETCDNGDPNEIVALLAGGMAHGLLLGQGLGGPARQFCPPNNGRLTNGQFRKATCDFLRSNPRIQSQEGYLAIGISLLKSFPCEAASKE